MKKNNWLSRLLSHNITLLILAFVISFISWIVITMMSGIDEKTVEIKDIPITISLTDKQSLDNEYRYFLKDTTPSTIDEVDRGIEKPLASVKVKGNAITVGSLDAGDIKITGSIDQVTNITPQEYTVSLSTSKTGIRTNYEIVADSVSPSSLTVFVDSEETKTLQIVNKLSVQTDEGKYVSTTLSESEVEVTGPETMMSKIVSAEVHGDIPIDKEKVTAELYFFDEEGHQVDTTYLKPDFSSVDVTVTSLPTKTVILNVDTKNAPEDAPVPNVTPESVVIAGPQETLDNTKTITIGSLDYAELNNENVKKSFTIPLPENCVIISDDSNTKASNKATATLNLDVYSSTTVEKISIAYSSSDYTVEFNPSSVDLTVCGPEDDVNSISASDITLTPDFTDKLKSLEKGQTVSLQNIPLTVKLADDYSKCWVYGTYTVEAKVTRK